MTTDTAKAQLVADLARSSSIPANLEVGGRSYLVGAYPPGWELQAKHIEDANRRPGRYRGTYRLADVDSLLAYITHQTGDDLASVQSYELPTVYLAPEQLRATAIFDDHTSLRPGWRDHIAVLQLEYTPEWKAWAGIDRKYLSAQDFADHVDSWRHTIADPPTADLLDLVRNFRATKKVTYGKEIVERSGDTSLEWTEETTAGHKSGKLDIPDGFGLVMSPFTGAYEVSLPARFRFMVDEGQARFGVVLDQPAKQVRDAFEVEIARVRGAGNFVVMVGTPDTSS